MYYSELLYFAECSIESLRQNVTHRNIQSTLIYLKSGTGKLYIEDECHIVSAGDLIIVPSQVRYRCWFDVPIEYIIIGFSKGGIDFPQSTVYAHDSADLCVLKQLENIKNEFTERIIYRKHVLNLSLSLVLILICRLAKICDVTKIDETDNFNYIINFINEFSQSNMKIEKISDMSGLSYHRFRHRFKEITGISPQQYIIRQRINKTKSILENTSFNTSLIARDCGFNSVPQFITCFSKQVGLTPSNYRRNYLAQKKHGIIK